MRQGKIALAAYCGMGRVRPAQALRARLLLGARARRLRSTGRKVVVLGRVKCLSAALESCTHAGGGALWVGLMSDDGRWRKPLLADPPHAGGPVLYLDGPLAPDRFISAPRLLALRALGVIYLEPGALPDPGHGIEEVEHAKV